MVNEIFVISPACMTYISCGFISIIIKFLKHLVYIYTGRFIYLFIHCYLLLSHHGILLNYGYTGKCENCLKYLNVYNILKTHETNERSLSVTERMNFHYKHTYTSQSALEHK